MLFKLLIVAFATAELTSAGVLIGRAPLSPAKLLEELSNLKGRDFCFNYIGAQVLVLPDYSTLVKTQMVLKTSIIRATATTTETIGTLRKGTSTTTITITVTTDPIITFAETFTTYITTTETVPAPPITTTVMNPIPQGGFPVRRRQAVELPEALVDSDPVSISAACTKAINKYPIYTTESQSKIVSTTATTTSTTTSTLTKTQKATQIDPYSIKTVSGGTITIIGNSTQTVSEISFATLTATETSHTGEPATTTVTHNACQGETTLPDPIMIRDPFPYSSGAGDAYIPQVMELNDGRTNMQKRLHCCTWCWSLRWGGGGCLGYKYRPNHCTVYYGSLRDSPNDICPIKRIGIMRPSPTGPGGGPIPEIGEWRPGPCAINGVKECFLSDVGQCQAQ